MPKLDNKPSRLKEITAQVFGWGVLLSIIGAPAGLIAWGGYNSAQANAANEQTYGVDIGRAFLEQSGFTNISGGIPDYDPDDCAGLANFARTYNGQIKTGEFVTQKVCLGKDGPFPAYKQ